MSTNGNGWAPRKKIPYTCVDGKVVYIQRPGPEFALRAARIPRTFTKSLVEDGDESKKQPTPEERLAQMSDEEQDSIVAFARQLLVAMVVSPKLKLNPKDGELGPDDTGADFWPLFEHGMTNFYNVKVPVGDAEVEVSDLETFRAESGIQGDSVDSVHVPITEPERAPTDPGLVHGAGT